MTSDIGLIGLGTMGSALALNIAEKGFNISVWNRTTQRTRDFHAGARDLADRITPTESLEALVRSIASPRAIFLMVPAGAPVDEQIEALRPLLGPDDLIIDAGNANFHDTNRRDRASSHPYLGVGVSGGEEGARHGPSMMGGGKRELWDRVAPILEAISAKYDGTPCAAWLGEEGAGHFVKTVHNGIEYADMQMIAEIYGILRDGMQMPAPEIGTVFGRWNDGSLQSYLIEISGKIAAAIDPASGVPVLDVIVDKAAQGGTGRWTVIEAQHLGAPVPAIDMAVVAQNLSSRREARATGEALFSTAPKSLPPGALDLDNLEQALIAGKILCYAQGFEMISAASNKFGWALPLPQIAKVWRAGCIIRSEMLNDMAKALSDDPTRNLALAPFFADKLKATHEALRYVVAKAALYGLATPSLASCLAYFDTLRTARGTTNMIQAQRDYFGLHGFERLDDGRSGQHGPWADTAN